MTDQLSIFAASAIALYAAHHVGDYWIQTDHQARHKGDAGHAGRMQCLNHCLSYVTTQTVFLAILFTVIPTPSLPIGQVVAALAVSGVTHYLADRSRHGVLPWLARRLPDKANLLTLGVPREPRVVEAWFDCASCKGTGRGGQAADASTGGLCWDCKGGGKLPSALTISDNPQLATGAWALDQAWHIFFGVFVAALVLAA